MIIRDNKGEVVNTASPSFLVSDLEPKNIDLDGFLDLLRVYFKDVTTPQDDYIYFRVPYLTVNSFKSEEDLKNNEVDYTFYLKDISITLHCIIEDIVDIQNVLLRSFSRADYLKSYCHPHVPSSEYRTHGAVCLAAHGQGNNLTNHFSLFTEDNALYFCEELLNTLSTEYQPSVYWQYSQTRTALDVSFFPFLRNAFSPDIIREFLEFIDLETFINTGEFISKFPVHKLLSLYWANAIDKETLGLFHNVPMFPESTIDFFKSLVAKEDEQSDVEYSPADLEELEEDIPEIYWKSRENWFKTYTNSGIEEGIRIYTPKKCEQDQHTLAKTVVAMLDDYPRIRHTVTHDVIEYLTNKVIEQTFKVRKVNKYRFLKPLKKKFIR